MGDMVGAVTALQEGTPRWWASPTLPPSIGRQTFVGDVKRRKSSLHVVNTSTLPLSERSNYVLYTTQLEKGAIRKKRDEGRSVCPSW